jgi:hypothetical protein
MTTKNKVATTVKVEPTLYDEFKILGIHYKITLQGLVEKTVFRYVKEDAFRNELNSFTIPYITGSSVSSSSLVA